jgi:hypothetical protein
LDINNMGAGGRIVALVRDLMFGARVRGAAPEAVLVQKSEALVAAVGPGTLLVILELEAPGSVEVVAAVREKAPGARVVGFAPHVLEERLAAAREAGAEVLPRGAFVKRLPELVAAAGGD